MIIQDIFKALLISALLSVTFSGCLNDGASSSAKSGLGNQNQHGEQNQNDTLQVTADSISAKWEIIGNSKFYSFEFNESGNYIVVESLAEKPLGKLESKEPGKVIFGTYEFIDETTIFLSDFGTLVITGLAGDSISFSLYLEEDSEKELLVNAQKTETLESSENTEILAKSWVVVKVNGAPAEEFDMNGITVLMSVSGTYFVEYPSSGEGGEVGGLASWKWVDENEDAFYYSWDTPPIWYEDSIVEVIELSSSKAIIYEYDELTEEGTTYELIPFTK